MKTPVLGLNPKLSCLFKYNSFHNSLPFSSLIYTGKLNDIMNIIYIYFQDLSECSYPGAKFELGNLREKMNYLFLYFQLEKISCKKMVS